MSKKIYKYEDVRDRIENAVDTLADPVRQTLSPKGSNVIYEDGFMNYVTNDGVTIAKSIEVEGDLENTIINIIKSAAHKTNSVAGDGTTTSILLAQNLIKSGLKLVDNGWNRMILKEELEKSCDAIVDRLLDMSIKVKDKKDIYNIAKISGNNDDSIAKDMVRVVDVVGEDGFVFLEPNTINKTELVEDTGFNIPKGYFAQELMPNGSFSQTYEDVPVLVTDKRIYYEEEAETILRVAVAAGFKSIVVVAREFIGKCPNVFITNHQKGVINVMLVAHPEVTETDNTAVSDLAAYLDGKLITEKMGRLVNKLKQEDFVIAKRVFVNPVKTVITTASHKNKSLASRVAFIKQELKKTPEDEKLLKRLASLTTGTITIKVGGATPIETRERVFRYEDAVNSTRAAIRDGYLVGGGVALLHAFNPKDHNPELVSVIQKFCEASIRQISENCGKFPDYVLDKIRESKNDKIGYNAKNDKFEDLLKAGVVDPYKVTEMAVINAFSVANLLITSRYFIVNEADKDKDNDKK